MTYITDRADSLKTPSDCPSLSSPSLPDMEELKNRYIYKEPRPKTKASCQSHPVVVPETPPKKVQVTDTEQSDDSEGDGAAGASVDSGREISTSLGRTPSSATLYPQRQGVSRMHLAREVKVLQSIEDHGSHSRSSRGSSSITCSLTNSEYVPTSDSTFGSQSSSTFTTSFETGANSSARDTSEVEASSPEPEATLSKVLLSDLDLPDGLLEIPRDRQMINRFKRFLCFQYRCIRRETAEPLEAISTVHDAYDFQRLRDQIATGCLRLSCLIERYKDLAGARLIWEDNSDLKLVRSLLQKCKDRLAEIELPSVGPMTFFTAGNDAARRQFYGTKVQQPTETTAFSSSQQKGKARAHPESESHVIAFCSVEATMR